MAAPFSFNNDLIRQTKFCLYTNTNQDEGIVLQFDKPLNKTITTNIPWKFFIHGWTTSPETSEWFFIHKKNYFEKGNYNIVFVDWSKSGNQSFINSVYYTKPVGFFFGDFLLNLHAFHVPLEQIHLLGHSLGSHMAGFAGKRVYEKLNKKINRITATDPARPLFEWPFLVPQSLRISENNAEFVDVFHTDSGNYGMQTAIGHIDVYFNTGKRFQPGCENIDDRKYFN